MGGELIIGLADRGTWKEPIFKRIIARLSNAKIVSTPVTGPVNTAQLRNKAYEAVTREYLVLLDADIWPDYRLFLKYQQKIISGAIEFSFIPCMYLSPFGSKQLIKNKSPETLIKQYFSFSRKQFLHLANPSSITVMRSKNFAEAGGFDEEFQGHGYEDFDFMLRLANLHGEIQKCGNMLDTSTARSPLFPSGFRRALGRLCLPALLDKDMAFHLHHDSSRKNAYYAARVDNLERFLSLHKELKCDGPESRSLVEDFIALCNSRSLKFQDYSALFENKPGHVDRYDTFKRRLRFLLND